MGAERPVTTAGGPAWLEQAKWFAGLNLLWIVLAAVAAWLGWRSYTLSVNSAVTQATVVRLVESETDSYSPQFEFAVDGQTYKVISQNEYGFLTSQMRFPEGKEVEIRYEVGNPQNAEINSLWDIWAETVLLSGFTILLAVGGNTFLVLRSRWKRAASA
jgi:hypothetical protein